MTDEKAGELRRHAGARDVGYGWLRIAWPESVPDCVLLVSTLALISVAFPHGSGDLDQQRASLAASIYASRNPQQNCDDLPEVAGCDVGLEPSIVKDRK